LLLGTTPPDNSRAVVMLSFSITKHALTYAIDYTEPFVHGGVVKPSWWEVALNPHRNMAYGSLTEGLMTQPQTLQWILITLIELSRSEIVSKCYLTFSIMENNL